MKHVIFKKMEIIERRIGLKKCFVPGNSKFVPNLVHTQNLIFLYEAVE